MKPYLALVEKILTEGAVKPNRTGVAALTLAGAVFEHDMTKGFPLLTTKNVPFRLVASELEFFIRGLTDKRWLQERGNHIWDEWCSPAVVPYSHAPETRERMKNEPDLGPVYGYQWRHFGHPYSGLDEDYAGKGIDQLASLIDTLKTNPASRRMLVSSWNPADLETMALPPCHYSFQVTVADGRLNLLWNQRSVDVALGLPFNIASYGLLLHLLARESGLEEGKLVGFLGDVHIYLNHVEGLRTQLGRPALDLPTVETPGFSGLFDWQYTDTTVQGYVRAPAIEFEIAV